MEANNQIIALAALARIVTATEFNEIYNQVAAGVLTVRIDSGFILISRN